ncbi:MAG: sigma-54-dependent Fis family transcriptional regulator, partial [Gemmatimonadetes bacterium]|nr:sigma-54-dependent Fis family transcriptional regulator [Gemmatimonadota bacterium]
VQDVPADVALLDIMLPDGKGIDLIEGFEQALGIPCIMMTSNATVASAVKALQLGARDYLEKPFSLDRLESVIAGTLEVTRLRREIRALRDASGARGDMLGRSPAMREVFTLVERVAPAGSATVLILGETGTGKGMLARLIHRLSPRATGPFVNITATALAETVMESELFGHEKGAFTDARSQKRGLVELADGGTLFLDEIGELSLRLQSKLLQFIEEKTFRRVGGNRDLRVDIRLLAATNRDLDREVAEGRFRSDLLYRLRVFPITLPSLRERKGDIPLLAASFVDHFNREFGRRLVGLAPDAIQALEQHRWPGNVRELRNAIERAVLLAEGPQVHAHDLPADLLVGGPALDPALTLASMNLETLARTLLVRPRADARGNLTEAGRMLGLSRHQMRYRLDKFGIREGS